MGSRVDILIRAGFGLALVILAGIGLLAYRGTEGLIGHANQVATTFQVIVTLDELQIDLLETESAARGYVLSGEESILKPYDAAVQKLERTVGHLERQLSGRPAPEIGELKSLIAQELDFHREKIDLRRTKGHEAASQLFLTGKGSQLMDQIRLVLAKLQDEEMRMLAARSQDARSDAGLSVRMLIFGYLLSFSILLLVYYNLVRQIARRRRSEEEISTLNLDLERRIAERTAELVATNRALESRNAEVERANRLKSEFLARMSHELRTPMNAIMGFSDLLAEEAEGPLNESYKRFVQHIRNGASHLLSLINDVLDLSKIEAGRIELNSEEFQAADALADVLSVIKPLSEVKQIRIDSEVDAGVVVRADRIRFKQVLYNLLSNALKFTPEGGRVWIAIRQGQDGIAFTVGDTGMGIPKDEQEAIFEEFHQVGTTTRGVKEGTGLGLAITRKLIELHGGKIWVESAPGTGSRFTFRLPAPAAGD